MPSMVPIPAPKALPKFRPVCSSMPARSAYVLIIACAQLWVPFCSFSAAMCFLGSIIVLLMVMPLAVVVTAGVAVNDGIVKEHGQHLLHGKIGSASVDADA